MSMREQRDIAVAALRDISSGSHIGLTDDVIPLGWYRGAAFSHEAQERIQKATVGNKNGIGNKANSGRFWVTNGLINRFMSKDESVPLNWWKGRRIK